MGIRYQECKSYEEGQCYDPGLRNGLNSLECFGFDRCNVYQVEGKPSRIDIISSNGNDGQVYLIEKIARAIAGDGADQLLGGRHVGKKRWELHLKQAQKIFEIIEEEIK